jgi:hypothetical protein
MSDFNGEGYDLIMGMRPDPGMEAEEARKALDQAHADFIARAANWQGLFDGDPTDTQQAVASTEPARPQMPDVLPDPMQLL